MRPPPSHLTVEHQRAAGRARAALFTKEQLSAAGRKGAEARMRQDSFYDHLCAIATDGPARQRVEMRAPKGSRLLKAEDVHLVRLADIHGNLGEPWPESKRRLLLARYVWVYIWSGLHEPARPTQQQFFALAARARARVERGLPLLNPLHVVGVAPDDFCNAVGRPFGWRNQRRLFRAALQQARDYACLLQALDDYFASLAQPGRRWLCEAPSPQPRTRVLGRRRPMSTEKPYQPTARPPRLSIHWRPIYQQLGRYHAPAFDQLRTRPAALLPAAQTHAYWLPPDTPVGDEFDSPGEDLLLAVPFLSSKEPFP